MQIKLKELEVKGTSMLLEVIAATIFDVSKHIDVLHETMGLCDPPETSIFRGKKTLISREMMRMCSTTGCMNCSHPDSLLILYLLLLKTKGLELRCLQNCLTWLARINR